MKTKEELKVELVVLQHNLQRAEDSLTSSAGLSEVSMQPTVGELQAQQALVTFLLDHWDEKCLQDEGNGDPYLAVLA